MKKLFAVLVLVLVGIATALAQDKNVHHIDFTQTLTGLDGKPLANGDAKNPVPLTLGDVSIAALEGALEEDKGLSGKAKFELDNLARHIYLNKDVILTPEEQTLLKDRIAKVWPPMIVGVTWRLIDPTVR